VSIRRQAVAGTVPLGRGVRGDAGGGSFRTGILLAGVREAAEGRRLGARGFVSIRAEIRL